MEDTSIDQGGASLGLHKTPCHTNVDTPIEILYLDGGLWVNSVPDIYLFV